MYEAPVGEVEETLAEIWCEVLHVQRIGRQDNFFELGGHSLLGTLVIGRLRGAFGIETPMRLLFEYPTLDRLASQLEQLLDASVLDDIEHGRNDIELLLETVDTLAESELQQFAQGIRVQGRP
jgi:acyl carrier protein